MITRCLRACGVGTLRRQLMLGVAVVHAILMALFVWDVSARQWALLAQHQEDEAQALARSMASAAAPWLAARDVVGLQEMVAAQSGTPALRFAMIVDCGGRVLAHTDTARIGQYVQGMDRCADVARGPLTTTLASSPEQVDVAAHAVLAGRAVGWVRLGLAGGQTAAEFRHVVRDALAYTLAAIAVGGLLAWWIAGRLTQRLQELQSVADAVQAGDVARRVAIDGDDEAAHLGRAFNTMLDSLAASRATLAAHEQRWLMALEASGLGVWDWHVPSGKVYYSAAWKTMLGHAEDEIGDRLDEWSQRVHPDDIAGCLADLDRHFRGETPVYRNEHRVRAQDGSWRWILDQGMVFERTADGRPLRVVGTHTDTTTRRALEQSVRDREAQLSAERDLFVGGPVAVLVWRASAGWPIPYASPNVHNVFGYTAAQMQAPGFQYASCVHPADLPRVVDEVGAYVSDPARAHWEQTYRIVWPDGSVHWMYDFTVAERDEDGRIQRLRGYVMDVTARHELEEAMRDSEARALQIIENAPVSMLVVDRQGRIVRVNGPTEALFGHARGDMIGQPIELLLPEAHRDAHRQACSGYMHDPTPRTMGRHRDLHGRRRDGSLFSAEISLAPMPAQGSVQVIASVVDVTERRALEAELRTHRDHLEELVCVRTAELVAARDEAQRLARAKSQFLANMSHEIRTPMNAVLGFSRMGVRDNAGRACQGTFERIHEAGTYLLTIINDILDFSKLDAGKLVIEQRAFRLPSVLDNASSLLAEAARHKQLRYLTRTDADVPEWVTGDAMRVQQILVNLLSNAVKFTERGEVCLQVTREGAAVCFHITDTGIGMSAEQLERLFTPFEQVDASTTRRHGGTGLGLAISRELAHRLGGEIEVRSAPGQGSTFTLRLPLASALPPPHAEAHAGALSGPRLPGLKVLAAEDVAANRLVLEDLLVHEGAEVVFADNGLAALDRVAEAGAQGFDVVLMDVQMPVMDGYESARRLAQVAPGMPVVGLTAHATAEERQRCFDAGMLDHVGKPVDANELVAAIRRVVGAGPAGRAPQPGDGEKDEAAAARHAARASVPIDWPALLAQFGGRQEFIGRLVSTAHASLAPLPERLRALAQAADAAGIRQVAHNVKGLAGTLMAGDLHGAALQCEASARAGAPDAAAQATALAESVDRVVHALAARAGRPA